MMQDQSVAVKRRLDDWAADARLRRAERRRVADENRAVLREMLDTSAYVGTLAEPGKSGWVNHDLIDSIIKP